MTWRTPVVILIFGIVIMMVSFGTRASVGLFLQPISDDFGWGREVFAFSVAIQNLFWGLSQPIAGAIADKYGSGRVIAVCIALLALGLYLMSQVTTPGELTLTAGILVGVGLSGTSFGVILAVISRSVPEHRRSLFLGIGSAGGAAGQLFMVPLGQSFLSSYGWMTTMALLAAMVLATLPLAFALTGKRSAAQAATASAGSVRVLLRGGRRRLCSRLCSWAQQCCSRRSPWRPSATRSSCAYCRPRTSRRTPPPRSGPRVLLSPNT